MKSNFFSNKFVWGQDGSFFLGGGAIAIGPHAPPSYTPARHAKLTSVIPKQKNCAGNLINVPLNSSDMHVHSTSAEDSNKMCGPMADMIYGCPATSLSFPSNDFMNLTFDFKSFKHCVVLYLHII